MAADLRDPDQPPGAVVEVQEDGTAVRNDGQELRPASRNPWYVLATVHGEQKDEEIDWNLHVKNRRIWNGWACAEMGEGERAKLAEALNLTLKDLAPLTDEEREAVDRAFRDRFGEGASPPSATASIDLAWTHYSSVVVLEKCVFASRVWFNFATFGGPVIIASANFREDADFSSAHFCGNAQFDNAIFKRNAWFQSTFVGDALFHSATFNDAAWFHSATFGGEARFASAEFKVTAQFTSATFKGNAWFPSAILGKYAWFNSAFFGGYTEFHLASFIGKAFFLNAEFRSTTDFESATFKMRVPKFQQAQMHQDTVFSSSLDQWPNIPIREVQEPSSKALDNDKEKFRRRIKLLTRESKRNYARLRQIMTELQRPDDAHFFLRQEMRCKAELEGPAYKTLIRAYGFFSEYGYSVWKPLLWLGVVWAFGAVTFARWPMQTPDLGPGAAMAVSLGNTLPFLGITKTYFANNPLQTVPAALKVLSGLQSVLAAPLLFFFGLGLHTRFRLR